MQDRGVRRPSPGWWRFASLLGEEAALARRLFLGAAFFDLYGLGGPGHAGRSLRAPSGMTERTVRSTTVGEARPAVRAPRGLDGDWSPGPRVRRRGVFAVRTGYGGRSSPRGRREAGRPSGLMVRREDGPGWTLSPRWRCPLIAPHREVGVCGRSGRVLLWAWVVGPRSARAFADDGPRNICSFVMVGERVGGCQGRCGGTTPPGPLSVSPRGRKAGGGYQGRRSSSSSGVGGDLLHDSRRLAISAS